jgi:hypothetical protein
VGPEGLSQHLAVARHHVPLPPGRRSANERQGSAEAAGAIADAADHVKTISTRCLLTLPKADKETVKKVWRRRKQAEAVVAPEHGKPATAEVQQLMARGRRRDRRLSCPQDQDN